MINYVIEHMDTIIGDVVFFLFMFGAGFGTARLKNKMLAKIEEEIEARVEIRIEGRIEEEIHARFNKIIENSKRIEQSPKPMFLTTKFLPDKQVQIASDTHIMSVSTLFTIPISHN